MVFINAKIIPFKYRMTMHIAIRSYLPNYPSIRIRYYLQEYLSYKQKVPDHGMGPAEISYDHIALSRNNFFKQVGTYFGTGVAYQYESGTHTQEVALSELESVNHGKEGDT